MIFLKLFFVFSYIGIFNFGGGYAMISFIQQEVVAKNGWMSDAEFTDIVAISQMTPGPVGINCATYVGYTSIMKDPEMIALATEADQLLSMGNGTTIHVLGVLGSVLATLSIVWLPFIVMILVSKLILRYKNSIVTRSIFGALRPAIVGLLATAAIALMTKANFGDYKTEPIQFILSIAIFAMVFIGMRRFKWNIIYTTLVCGILGIFVYGVMGI